MKKIDICKMCKNGPTDKDKSSKIALDGFRAMHICSDCLVPDYVVTIDDIIDRAEMSSTSDFDLHMGCGSLPALDTTDDAAKCPHCGCRYTGVMCPACRIERLKK